MDESARDHLAGLLARATREELEAFEAELVAWRRAATLLQQLSLQRHPAPVPVPKGPTRDDLWELWLRLNNELPDRPAAVVEFWEHAQIDARARAADLLERHPEPVPVSERLPGPGDCHFNPGAEIGSCWCFNPVEHAGGIAWWSFEPLEWNESATHWLPATAMPLPAGEVSDDR